MCKFLVTLYLLSFFGIAQAVEFSEGQIWSYKARAGEEKSTLLINKIETVPKLGQIFHISIFGVQVKNSRVPSGIITEPLHMPVSKQTLDESVVKLVGKSKIRYLEEYKEWRAAFDRGEGGVFTIPIQKIVDVVEKGTNQ